MINDIERKYDSSLQWLGMFNILNILSIIGVFVFIVLGQLAAAFVCVAFSFIHLTIYHVIERKVAQYKYLAEVAILRDMNKNGKGEE